MVTSFENWSKLEMRGVIRFLYAKESSPTKFNSEIIWDYGKDVMNKR